MSLEIDASIDGLRSKIAKYTGRDDIVEDAEVFNTITKSAFAILRRDVFMLAQGETRFLAFFDNVTPAVSDLGLIKSVTLDGDTTKPPLKYLTPAQFYAHAALDSVGDPEYYTVRSEYTSGNDNVAERDPRLVIEVAPKPPPFPTLTIIRIVTQQGPYIERTSDTLTGVVGPIQSEHFDLVFAQFMVQAALYLEDLELMSTWKTEYAEHKEDVKKFELRKRYPLGNLGNSHNPGNIC